MLIYKFCSNVYMDHGHLGLVEYKVVKYYKKLK